MGKPSFSAIYQIRHIASGKVYVGSAVSYISRIEAHKRMLCGRYHVNVKLQRAWDKYGEGEFAFEVLELVHDVNDLLACEQKWIDCKNAILTGYNLSPTAGSLLGFKHADESRKKMSESRKGKPKSAQTIEKSRQALIGRKMTQEQCQKMREAKLGKKRSPHSEETKAKMSAAAAGRQFSDEHRLKLSLAKTGKPWTAKRRASISTAP